MVVTIQKPASTYKQAVPCLKPGCFPLPLTVCTLEFLTQGIMLAPGP